MTNWIERWTLGQIGWHRDTPNAKLIEHIDCLKLAPLDLVFVPLCGKSVDMAYLLRRGFRVIGVELSELAIVDFFRAQNLTYSVENVGQFQRYSAPNIQIYCGDYFQLKASDLRGVTAIYDRAALIALPADFRVKYAAHLCLITPADCAILLLTMNYPQAQMSGPPFAVDKAEVAFLYQSGFDCQQLQCFNDIENEPKFQRANVDFVEKATYCLRKK